MTPIAKRDLNDGRVAVFVLPQIHHPETAVQIISNVPTLENAIRMPTEFIKNQDKVIG